MSVFDVRALVFVEGAVAVQAVIVVQGRLFLIDDSFHPLDYTLER